jgi:hypothetical protein
MLKELSKMKNNQLSKNLLICGDNLRALDDLKKKKQKGDYKLAIFKQNLI